jgi:hypothetical protein
MRYRKEKDYFKFFVSLDDYFYNNLTNLLFYLFCEQFTFSLVMKLKFYIRNKKKRFFNVCLTRLDCRTRKLSY